MRCPNLIRFMFSIFLVINMVSAILVTETANSNSSIFGYSYPTPNQFKHQIINGSLLNFRFIGYKEISYNFNLVRPYSHTTCNRAVIKAGVYAIPDKTLNIWLYDFKELSVGTDSEDCYAEIIGQKLYIEKVEGDFGFEINPNDKRAAYGYSEYIPGVKLSPRVYASNRLVIFKWNTVGDNVGHFIFWHVKVAPGNYAIFKVISKMYVPEHYAVVVEMTIRIDAPGCSPQYATGNEEAEIRVLGVSAYVEPGIP